MNFWKNFSQVVLGLIISMQVMAGEAGFLPVANILNIKGKALVNKMKAKVGDEIAEGAVIKLSKKTDYVDIKYQNGHIIRVAGGEIKVTELNPKSSVISLINGKIFNFIKTLTQNEKFVVNTKRASFAVRGTQFFIDETKKESYLCVCEGTVKATQLKTNKEVDVSKDQDLFVNEKKKFEVQASNKMMTSLGNKTFKEIKNLK